MLKLGKRAMRHLVMLVEIHMDLITCRSGHRFDSEIEMTSNC